MRRILFLFIQFFISSHLLGQEFRFECKLPSPDSSGFYKILLSPEVYSRLQPGFSDLRIFDDNQKEVAYILKEVVPVKYSNTFREYEIVDKKFLKDSVTQIVIKNKSGAKISNISLIIRNADVQKQMRLTGSFDGKQWFVVKESEFISSISNASEVSEIKLFNFPLTDYSFYRIELNDKHSAPVDVIKAGYYESETTNEVSAKLNSSFTTNDSLKQKTTWIHLSFKDTLIVDDIEFKISEPEYYLRNADIYYSNIRLKNNYNNHISHLSLNSKFNGRFSIGSIKAKELWIEIYNEDNAPLKFSDINCFQYNHYIIAKLSKGKEYNLRLGDAQLHSPEYDIKYFESVIPSDLKILIPDSMHSIQHEQQLKESSLLSRIFSDKRFIWTALIVVLVVLGIATFKMMRDVK